MSAGRPPVANGAYARLSAFFEANPGEELSYADAIAKFGLTHGTIRQAVYRLRAAGKLESVHVIRRPAKGRAA